MATSKDHFLEVRILPNFLDTMMLKLQREGEQITVEDIGKYLYLLVGEREFKSAMTEEVNAEDFAQTVLGFEEVEEDDSDGDLEGEEEEAEEMDRHVAF